MPNEIMFFGGNNQMDNFLITIKLCDEKFLARREQIFTIQPMNISPLNRI